MTLARTSLLAGVAPLALLVAAGCCPSAPPASINHHLSSPEDLDSIRRVVFIELPQEPGYAGIAEDTTVAVAEAIRARRLFRLDVIGRDDPICETVMLESAEGFSMAQLRQMRDTFHCDAILLGRVRNFRPHPCMRVGLDLCLLDLRRGKPVWVVDHTWDTTDKVVEKRIKQYYCQQLKSGLEPMEWQIVTISPQAFEKFVAFETAQTLRPLPPAELCE